MSETVGTKRTAAMVIAENEAREKAQRKRTLRVLGSIAVFVLGYVISCHPQHQYVRVSAQRTVDIISLSQESSVRKMFGDDGDWAGPALVVSYYSASKDRESQGYERLDLFRWARPEADRLGLNAIVLWRTEPVISRWIPYVRGDIRVFKKHADGAWPGL